MQIFNHQEIDEPGEDLLPKTSDFFGFLNELVVFPPGLIIKELKSCKPSCKCVNFLLSSSQVQLFPPVIMLGGEVGGSCPVRLVQLLLQKYVAEGSPECHSVPQN